MWGNNKIIIWIGSLSSVPAYQSFGVGAQSLKYGVFLTRNHQYANTTIVITPIPAGSYYKLWKGRIEKHHKDARM